MYIEMFVIKGMRGKKNKNVQKGAKRKEMLLCT